MNSLTLKDCFKLPMSPGVETLEVVKLLPSLLAPS